MTRAMLNAKLYQKMFAEQALFKAELILLSPVEVLDRAYEYVCREDILIALEYNDLSFRQARAHEVVRADFVEARRDAR